MCRISEKDFLIVNKMDVLRQVDSAWNLYEDQSLVSCSDEKTFMDRIANYLDPSIDIEFQGQLH